MYSIALFGWIAQYISPYKHLNLIRISRLIHRNTVLENETEFNLFYEHDIHYRLARKAYKAQRKAP